MILHPKKRSRHEKHDLKDLVKKCSEDYVDFRQVPCWAVEFCRDSQIIFMYIIYYITVSLNHCISLYHCISYISLVSLLYQLYRILILILLYILYTVLYIFLDFTLYFFFTGLAVISKSSVQLQFNFHRVNQPRHRPPTSCSNSNQNHSTYSCCFLNPNPG